ncbi:GNAT family N-acetyltransferase [Streptomyces sp. NBC_00083]|uniref:GNAT family N-acetyltransferase n=1 Tax=Streptomyces sp. NBC_00083 TaxID=2975647 RepID=UPI0022540A86|nr:GNAT family N-acetyltransferase [Streptomyces sp. NBC_00083]MCX5385604.1 GNAT family N-acetyltransferase [Streptomyces sp. NBC_00083]
MSLRIRRAAQRDAEAAVGILDEAFRDDPVSCWVLPDPARRPAAHPRLMAAFFQISLDEGHVDLAEDGSAVALWLDVPAEPQQPGGGDDGPAQLRAYVDPDNERVELMAHFMGAHHPHGRAHAYLMMVGVLPDRQGRGLGTELITAVLERCDREGLPAYLEASSERSPALYRRLGFAPLGEPVRLPDGPQVFPMWREPKA